jgi:NitT/TauT family transport system substrate-binding protein
MSQQLRGVVTLVVSAALVAAACATGAPVSPTAGPTQSAAPTASATASPAATALPVTGEAIQLVFVLNASDGPLLWGKEQGFFEDHGIDLDIIPGRGSDLALAEINSGRVNFAMVDLTNYVAQRAAADTETTAVYVFSNIATVGIASLTPINEPADMVGKTFGTVAQSSGRLSIPLVLKQNGVDWDPDKQIQLMDFAVLYPTLFSGGIDTAEVGLAGSWESAFLRAQDQGITLHLKLLADWGFLDYSKVLIVRDELIERDPERVRNMVAAVAESQADARENATADEIFRLLSAVDPQADEKTVGLVWDSFTTYVKNPGPMDAAVFQYKLDRLAEQGTETDLTPADLFTNEFIP